MSMNRRLLLPLATFGVIVGVLGLLAVMTRYESTRRSERVATFNTHFAALAEKLPDMEKLRRIRLAHKDRVQPLDSVARSTLRTLSGKRTLYKQDPVLVFLSLCFDPIETWSEVPLIVVQHLANKEMIGMDPADNLASLKQVRMSEDFQDAVQKLSGRGFSDLHSQEQEVIVINSHVRELDNGFAHMMLIAPPWPGQDADPQTALDWHLPMVRAMPGHEPAVAKDIESRWHAIQSAWVARDMAGVNAAVSGLETACQGVAGRHWLAENRVERELTFNTRNPTTTASYFYVISAILALFGAAFGISWLHRLAMGVAVGGLAMQGYGLFERTTLGFGVTITNLYESMIAVAAASVLICLVVDFFRKTSWCTMAGGAAGFFVLQIVDIYSVKFDAGIGGTIAVLANNFWVHIHVPVVMSSYAAFFIAWMLSLIGLPWFFAARRDQTDPEFKSLVRSVDVAINLGTVLIFVGLILGGIWAHDSWGRFWGWDPKETWAAALFLWFVIGVVHGRFAYNPNPFLTLWWTFGGGAALLFTYYGTNELLSGLHSYANSAGSGGFWDNAMHDRNRWFVWSMGGIIGIWFLLPMAYFLGGFNRPAIHHVPAVGDAGGLPGKI